jgi:DNA methylase
MVWHSQPDGFIWGAAGARVAIGPRGARSQKTFSGSKRQSPIAGHAHQLNEKSSPNAPSRGSQGTPRYMPCPEERPYWSVQLSIFVNEEISKVLEARNAPKDTRIGDHVAATVRERTPSIQGALTALARMERELGAAETYVEIKKIVDAAEALKVLHREVDEVRQQCEWVVLVAGRRISDEIEKVPKAAGRPTKIFTQAGNNKSGRAATGIPGTSRSRLKKLRAEPVDKLRAVAEKLWGKGKDATVRAVVEEIAVEKSRERREKSRNATPLVDGMEMRIGDCRMVLSDVPVNSVPLILTDAPYIGHESAVLYEWLGEFAAKVLIPGGSLICYTGHWSLNRDMRIFDKHLRYWWMLAMMHHQSKSLPGKFVIANFKPVLWYVKEFRRGRTLMPDILRSPARDKSLHNWSQGEGGVSQIIEHLTEPGELIIDPFAGTGNWGRIAANMGRRWLGADVVMGGDQIIKAERVLTEPMEL